MRLPVFIALASIITGTTLCGGILYVLSETVFSCKSSGFPYPNSIGSEHYVAQVVSIDCGATSDFDARVVLSMRSNDGKENDQETVFMSGLDPRTVTLKWESTDRLVVEYEQSNYARITKSLTTWRNVTITYRIKE